MKRNLSLMEFLLKQGEVEEQSVAVSVEIKLPLEFMFYKVKIDQFISPLI